MSYEEALLNLAACAEEWAEIYHRIRIAEAWMRIGFFLCLFSLALCFINFTMPRLKAQKQAAATACKKQAINGPVSAVKQPVYKNTSKAAKMDIDDILAEFYR